MLLVASCNYSWPFRLYDVILGSKDSFHPTWPDSDLALTFSAIITFVFLSVFILLKFNFTEDTLFSLLLLLLTLGHN